MQESYQGCRTWNSGDMGQSEVGTLLVELVGLISNEGGPADTGWRSQRRDSSPRGNKSRRSWGLQ